MRGVDGWVIVVEREREREMAHRGGMKGGREGGKAVGVKMIRHKGEGGGEDGEGGAERSGIRGRK